MAHPKAVRFSKEMLIRSSVVVVSFKATLLLSTGRWLAKKTTRRATAEDEGVGLPQNSDRYDHRDNPRIEVARMSQPGSLFRPGGPLNDPCSAGCFGTPSSAQCSRFYMSEPTSKLLHFSKLSHKRLETFTQNSTSITLARTGHHMPQKMICIKKSMKSERRKIARPRLNELKRQPPDAPSTRPLRAASSSSRVGARQSVGKAMPLHESGGQLPF